MTAAGQPMTDLAQLLSAEETDGMICPFDFVGTISKVVITLAGGLACFPLIRRPRILLKL
jgi:hypothetical protein